MHVLADRAFDALRLLAFRHRRWSIGILRGPSPFLLSPPPDVRNPVLRREDVTDVHAAFVADPFMIHEGGEWHMFLEVVAVRPGGRRGEIGHATSRDGLRWEYRGVVLREPFHLSYPYVFRAGAELFLLPETGGAGCVRLYRADPFPRRWTLAGTLLRAPGLVDSSIFRHDGRWWMFCQSASARGHDTLRLFHAAEILGPWAEHPASPVVAGDARVARPAGRVISLGDRVIRFAQDCRDGYGMRVHAREVLRLTPGEYAEADCAGNPFLDGSGAGWNRSGMHHVDAQPAPGGGWLACVDGWTSRPWDAWERA